MHEHLPSISITIEQIAAEPARARDLAPETIWPLLAQCGIAHGALLVALASSCQPGRGEQAEIRLLTVEEAAAKLSVTPEWLYRRGKGLGLAAKLGDGTLRFSNVAVEAYIRAQTNAVTSSLPARRRRKGEVRDLTD